MNHLGFVDDGPRPRSSRLGSPLATRTSDWLGRNLAQQYLSAGLLDELLIHLVPVLLGGGVRLFENLESRPQLEAVQVVFSQATTI